MQAFAPGKRLIAIYHLEGLAIAVHTMVQNFGTNHHIVARDLK